MGNARRFDPLALSLPLLAQEQTASIQGVITDSTGAALPGVTVEASSADRGQKLAVQSDSGGHYQFPSVPPGVYTVTASLSGMQSAIAKDVQAKLGTSPKVDLVLKVAAVSESVTVTAEPQLVDVTSSAAQTSIRTETFEKLPRGRDFSTVVVQAPSANQNNKDGGISIDGASGAENRYIMDGVDTTNPQTGVQGKALMTEFVDEVQVKSAGYPAEFGGSTGGVINVVTKTGTNDFKGTLGGEYTNTSWNGQERADRPRYARTYAYPDSSAEPDQHRLRAVRAARRHDESDRAVRHVRRTADEGQPLVLWRIQAAAPVHQPQRDRSSPPRAARR